MTKPLVFVIAVISVRFNLINSIHNFASEESQNQVELNFISEKMRRFTDFFQKEGILDVIKSDYYCVKTTDYYGYVVQIEFDFKRYKKSKES
jgi:hypothetical protein